MKKISGIIAAPFTPFNQDHQVDYERIEMFAQLLKRNQADGAFICGTTGESSSLSHQEKIRIFESWSNHRHAGLQLIAMLGGTCLEEMKELAVVAANLGLDGISILAPYYLKPNLDQLIEVCAQVAASAPDLPFFYYHIPSLTGAYFSMRVFLEKAEAQIPNLAGIKYTHSDLMDFSLCKMHRDGYYSMLWGSDEILLSGLVAGADGAVGSTYNYALPLYQEIIKNFNLGNIPEAAALQKLSMKMVDLLMKHGGNRAGKGFMKIIGVDCGPCRLPLTSLTNEQISQLEADLHEINFPEFCSKF